MNPFIDFIVDVKKPPASNDTGGEVRACLSRQYITLPYNKVYSFEDLRAGVLR
ncbi:hypothetical protein SAMN05660830_02084 [Halodesulfovibrio aestuarii]|uniref:Uncharacterized protein n=1 Tax=Halodesulfovibrio aestuarii TaxID=126333 RepID=A0A8G2CAB8_9BACT|nr:hypothetical protein SAMN05660830_02084 [Halodesulfovibrio aestuarii]